MSREIRLGIFIVLTLGILAVGVFLIGDRESRFRSTYRIKTGFRTVSGLTLGADVHVGGVQKGTVREIRLPKRPDGEVAVLMDLRTETREILKRDSVASIKSEGLLGDKFVEISFGGPEAERLKDGDTIQSEPPLDISDLFIKTNKILDTAQGAVENAQVTTTRLSSITSKIDQGQGTVGALINDKTVYNQASAGATALREDAEALKHNFLTRGFFKKRGYEDSSDLKKHAISKLPPGPYEKAFAYDAKQIFDAPDTAKLRNQKTINEAGKFLEDQAFDLAVVTASTGMKGDTEKNRTLSEARASVVRDYLSSNFRLDDTRIKTMGLGKSDKGENGNVEIIVYTASAARREQPGTR